MAFSISMFTIKISYLTTNRLNHLVPKSQILLKIAFLSNSVQFKIIKTSTVSTQEVIQIYIF